MIDRERGTATHRLTCESAAIRAAHRCADEHRPPTDEEQRLFARSPKATAILATNKALREEMAAAIDEAISSPTGSAGALANRRLPAARRGPHFARAALAVDGDRRAECRRTRALLAAACLVIGVGAALYGVGSTRRMLRTEVTHFLLRAESIASEPYAPTGASFGFDRYDDEETADSLVTELDHLVSGRRILDGWP